MKKVIFGLIATVVFGFGGNAQDLSKEEARVITAKVMVEITKGLEPAYRNSTSFETFIKNGTGPYNPNGVITLEGRNLLKVAYNYLQNHTSSSDIIANYSGVEVAKAFKYLKDDNSKNEGDLFGTSVTIARSMGEKAGHLPMNLLL